MIQIEAFLFCARLGGGCVGARRALHSHEPDGLHDKRSPECVFIARLAKIGKICKDLMVEIFRNFGKTGQKNIIFMEK